MPLAQVLPMDRHRLSSHQGQTKDDNFSALQVISFLVLKQGWIEFFGVGFTGLTSKKKT